MVSTNLTLIERLWKVHTEKANALFDRQRYEPALQRYQTALEQAECLCENVTGLANDVPIIQILVISHNNLAFTYEAMNQLACAERMLRKVVYRLMEMCNHRYMNLQHIEYELRRAALIYRTFIEANDLSPELSISIFDDIRRHLSRVDSVDVNLNQLH